ncbi:MAG TPA: glycosyltransferase family 87 protein [Candidatus Acidoferrales bacterium]|nr:glycosyltransferase family 87 protein [Candidatus Acidoferrales bacterium]
MTLGHARINIAKYYALLMSAMACVSLVLSVPLFMQERERIAKGYGDFIIFYTGAQMLKVGAGSKLYDLRTQKDFQDKFDVPIRTGPLPFNHPPFELLWFLPLTSLEYFKAYQIWSVLNIAFLAGVLVFLAPPLARRFWPMFILMFAGFYPATVTLLHGQDSILLTFLMAAAIRALKFSKDRTAGVLLAVGLFKPQLILPTILVLIVNRRWAAMLSFLATSVTLAAVSIKLVGVAGVRQYLELLAQIDRAHYTIAPGNMPNLRGFIYSLVGLREPVFFQALLITLSAGFLVALLYYAKNSLAEREQRFDLTVCLTVLVTLITSYHLYIHDLTLLLIPVVLAIKSTLISPVKLSLHQRVILSLILVFWIPFLFSYQPLLAREQMSLGFLGVVLFATLIAASLRRRLKTNRQPGFRTTSEL